MVGMGGMGVGGSLSAGGRQLVRLATMGLMFGGVGMAGFGFYGENLPPEAQGAQAFIQDNTKALIIVGVAAIVLGAVLNWYFRQRMMKQMTAGMPDFSKMMGMGMPMGGPMAPAQQVVKVRCGSCGTLQAEEAEFCSKCGKGMGTRAGSA